MKKYTFDTTNKKCNSRYINSDYFRRINNKCWLTCPVFIIEHKGRIVGYKKEIETGYKEVFFAKKVSNYWTTTVAHVGSRKALGRLLRKLPPGEYFLSGTYVGQEIKIINRVWH